MLNADHLFPCGLENTLIPSALLASNPVIVRSSSSTLVPETENSHLFKGLKHVVSMLKQPSLMEFVDRSTEIFRNFQRISNDSFFFCVSFMVICLGRGNESF